MGEGMLLQNPQVRGGKLLQNSPGEGPYLLQIDTCRAGCTVAYSCAQGLLVQLRAAHRDGRYEKRLLRFSTRSDDRSSGVAGRAEGPQRPVARARECLPFNAFLQPADWRSRTSRGRSCGAAALPPRRVAAGST
jgi:hypothetical protein